jgi:hypothetical protein
MHEDAKHPIRRTIESRALTIAEIATATGLNARTVYRRVAVLAADGRIHVEAWTELRGSGPRAKLYRWGKGRDAPPPAVMTPNERAAMTYARRKAAARELDCDAPTINDPALSRRGKL